MYVLKCLTTEEEFISLEAAAKRYDLKNIDRLKKAAWAMTDGRKKSYGRHFLTNKKLFWVIIKK